MKKLTLLEIKQALWDERFRNLFPEYQEQIREFLHNPGCACNIDLYSNLFKHKDRLQKYFPTKEIVEEESPSQWKVINCHINELEGKLRKLSKTKKQIAIARYQDQVTVVINEIESHT